VTFILVVEDKVETSLGLAQELASRAKAALSLVNFPAFFTIGSSPCRRINQLTTHL